MDPCELWAMIGELVAPYEGELPRAIRADLFFHLNLASTDHRRFRLKNLLYPALLMRRALTQPSNTSAVGQSRNGLLLVADYAAEAGIGALRPLFGSSMVPLILVINDPVRKRHYRELQGLPLNLSLIDNGVKIAELRGAIQETRRWQRDLAACAAKDLAPLMRASSLVIEALLLRAALYRMRLRQLVENAQPAGVVTHNDFTSLSYLAGQAARFQGIPDVTLQHGIPSLEYFPTSASYYFTWGPAFTEIMRSRSGDTRTKFFSVGAPRLDKLVSSASIKAIDNRPFRLLFLSQIKSSIFAARQRDLTIRLLREIAALPDLDLFVRPHPQDGDFWAANRPGPSVNLTPPSRSLKEDILLSDAVTSFCSTGMLEAALLGKPVLQLETAAFDSRGQSLQFEHVAKDAAEVNHLLNCLRSASGLDIWLRTQTKALTRLIAAPGEGTSSFWRAFSELTEQQGKSNLPLPVVWIANTDSQKAQESSRVAVSKG